MDLTAFNVDPIFKNNQPNTIRAVTELLNKQWEKFVSVLIRVSLIPVKFTSNAITSRYNVICTN